MQGEFIIEVSKRIKKKRTEKGFTLEELANKSGVTKGLISQIENGRTIPSLPVLFNIIQSLEIGVSDFFGKLNLSEPTVIVQRKEAFESFEKENTTGFIYKRMFTRSLKESTVDFVLLEVQPEAEREVVSTEAFEFKYILKGEIDYLINNQIYNLKEGDALFFDGRLPHVPKNTTKESCTMIIVYFFDSNI